MKRHELPEDISEIFEDIPVTTLLIFDLSFLSCWPFSFMPSVTVIHVRVVFIVILVVIIIILLLVMKSMMMLNIIIAEIAPMMMVVIIVVMSSMLKVFFFFLIFLCSMAPSSI